VLETDLPSRRMTCYAPPQPPSSPAFFSPKDITKNGNEITYKEE
jgi:hypothetical protein